MGARGLLVVDDVEGVRTCVEAVAMVVGAVVGTMLGGIS